MKKIISASRRTDIPAFYSDWFVDKLKNGFVCVRQPYNNKITKVSLKPEDIHSIVFWSKNYNPFLSKLELVEKTTKSLFFHFTVTGLPHYIEPFIPDWKEALKDMSYLSQRYGSCQVVWRFDPIVLTRSLGFDFYEDTFLNWLIN